VGSLRLRLRKRLDGIEKEKIMTTNLTKRQAQVLDLIERQQVPPTLREIGLHMGIRSTNGVNDHLHSLERKGRIFRGEMKTRHLRVLVPLSPEERTYYMLGAFDRCPSCGHALMEGDETPLSTRIEVSGQKLAG
jgi:SOS-response transcriptional repressor LexA